MVNKGQKKSTWTKSTYSNGFTYDVSFTTSLNSFLRFWLGLEKDRISELLFEYGIYTHNTLDKVKLLYINIKLSSALFVCLILFGLF